MVPRLSWLNRGVRVPAERKRDTMPTWLIILLVGVVLLVFGVAVEAAKFLIWLGIIVLVVSLVVGLIGRGKARV
ncbi:hypothetical protein GCM10010488_02030 [Oerskovia jenensis]